MKRSSLFLLILLASITSASGSREGYYRFPALHQSTIVFSAEGDLWTVPLEGGLARRLTTHAGEETSPSISPDGQWVAFSASYEGPTEVYVMRISGGAPKRLTYESSASIVTNWTPDGRVLYATGEYATMPDPQLIIVDPQTGQRESVPLTPASDATYDDRGATLFFTNPDFHRNNTKRYEGGTARNIWRFGQGDTEAINLTSDYPGENYNPMWWNGRVYFLTERDGTMNIWSMKIDGKDLKQHTQLSGWDVLSADLSDGRIVYRVGADLWQLKTKGGQSTRIPITLASDFDQLRERWVSNPMQYLTSASIHPSGESVALTARGRVFVAPLGNGRLVQAARKPGVRFRDAAFMPDGERLLVLSDESGETEFQFLPVNGVGEPTALTDNGTILRFAGYPSPDGKRVAFTDKNADLWVIEIASRSQDKVSSSREGAGDISWSPDSRWIAFTQGASNLFSQIHLYDVESKGRQTVTSDRVNSRSPAWSPDGRFLYFLSDRNLRSQVGSPWGSRQPEPYFDRQWKVYEMALQKGLRSPFRPADELSPRESKRDTDTTEAPPAVDVDGLARRVTELPIESGNYRGLEVTKQALFMLNTVRGSRNRTHLIAVKISNKPEDQKPLEVAEEVRGFQLSADRKKALVTKGTSLHVIDAAPRKAKLQDSKVDLNGWSFAMNVQEDLRQLYIDAWRLERDYFWDPGMHGLDWDAMRDKYLGLVDRVTSRAELSDVIGQLVGELSALHVSVRGGDLRTGADRIRLPSLGARLARDESAGGYRIDYIYQSDPDYPTEMSPLSDHELGISVGDVITAINGTPVLDEADPNQLLRNQADRQVLLTVKSGAGESRDVIVTPTNNGRNLRYSDWEYTRRLEVDRAGDGELGYVHLRAMGGGNITEWYRNFYPVFNRKGLIIDVRHNRGGNIDAFILEKLMRRAWFYWKDRVGQPTWNLHYAFRGHMVVLVDEDTASDGEAFAEGFRRLGLGKIIGTRTWGGEIWLSSNNRLTDGGLARAPQTGVYGPEREWLIEGHGVDPDIVVENLPHSTFNGKDAQLEAAIRYLKEEIRKDPRDVPEPPPYPDKSFDYPPGAGNPPAGPASEKPRPKHRK